MCIVDSSDLVHILQTCHKSHLFTVAFMSLVLSTGSCTANSVSTVSFVNGNDWKPICKIVQLPYLTFAPQTLLVLFLDSRIPA